MASISFHTKQSAGESQSQSGRKPTAEKGSAVGFYKMEGYAF